MIGDKRGMAGYPAVSKETYSVPRFWRDFHGQSLPSRILLGGELQYESSAEWSKGNFVLVGQGQIVRFLLKTPLQTAVKNGVKVLLEIDRDQILSDGTVVKTQDLRLLGPSLREPLFLSASPDLLQKWSEFIDGVRSYFKARGLLEVLTPSLVRNPGMEPELEPFSVELRVGSLRKQLFLPTSPELHLKQMMVNGFTDIFEVKTCFRNGEITERHQPEFQMLEWYRAYSNLDLIREDLVGLLKAVAKVTEVRTTSMKELFQKYLDFKLTPVTTREDMANLCREKGLDFNEDGQSRDDWNELFHRIFIEKIEPMIGLDCPEIVCDFPPSMAALARLTPEGFADRFELFWRGSEIANAFHELNDPVEQRSRFENEIIERRRKGKTALIIDENFMRALEAGLPPSGGIALGLDRLFMAIHGVSEIGNSRAFAIRHQL